LKRITPKGQSKRRRRCSILISNPRKLVMREGGQAGQETLQRHERSYWTSDRILRQTQTAKDTRALLDALIGSLRFRRLQKVDITESTIKIPRYL